MKKIPTLFTVGWLAFIGACNKKEPAPATPTRTQLLVGKKWQLTSDVLSYTGYPNSNLYAQMRPCSQDDYRQFNLPNTYVHDEGATKCSTLASQTTLGIWAFSANDSKLTITDQNYSDTYTITDLTESSLTMTMPVPQSLGGDATATLTFTVIQ
jgi:hypothetical protein